MNASGNPHPFEAERFELHGEQLVVDYQQLRGTRALRRMSVVGADGELRFYVGGEIRAEETPAGTMVSVVTSFAFDGDTELLSVLLPDVNLSREPSAPIRTVGIRTVHRGHLGGPGFIDGALSTHEAVTLTGTASRDEPEDTPSGVRCEWSAWYNRMPGRDDPNLYVAGRCGFPSGSMTWTLEPDTRGSWTTRSSSSCGSRCTRPRSGRTTSSSATSRGRATPARGSSACRSAATPTSRSTCGRSFNRETPRTVARATIRAIVPPT